MSGFNNLKNNYAFYVIIGIFLIILIIILAFFLYSMPKLEKELVKESLTVKIKKNKYNKLITKKFIKNPKINSKENKAKSKEIRIKCPKINNKENRKKSKEIRIKSSNHKSPKKLQKRKTYAKSNPPKKKRKSKR